MKPWFLLLALLPLSACSDNTGDDDSAVDDDDTTDDAICHDEDDPDIGSAVQMSDSLHTAGGFWVDLGTMSSDYDADGDWQWAMQMSADGPVVTLGEGVEAVNMGAAGFHSVDVAPVEGYGDGGEELRTGWQDGGVGETGFDMSEFVYVLKTDDGHFAKLEILSAAAGTIEWQGYFQADGGSCNLRTE